MFLYEVCTVENHRGEVVARYTADTKEYAIWMLKAKMQDKNYLSSRVLMEPMKITRSEFGNGNDVNVYMMKEGTFGIVGRIDRDKLEEIVGEEMVAGEVVSMPFLTQFIKEEMQPFLKGTGYKGSHLRVIS